MNTEIVTLRAPAQWTLQVAPKARHVKNLFGSAERTVRTARGTLVVRQTMTLRRTWQPAGNAAALYQLIQTADRFSNIIVTFTRSGGILPTAPVPRVVKPSVVKPPPTVKPPVVKPPRPRARPQPRPALLPPMPR